MLVFTSIVMRPEVRMTSHGHIETASEAAATKELPLSHQAQRLSSLHVGLRELVFQQSLRRGEEVLARLMLTDDPVDIRHVSGHTVFLRVFRLSHAGTHTGQFVR